MNNTKKIKLPADVKAIRRARELYGVTRNELGLKLGISNKTIEKIENGRIELSNERIRHIVESYGYKYMDFENNLNQEELRDQIIDTCIDKINQLDDSKLGMVKNLLGSL